MKHWYLVHTKPRKERVAEQNLLRQGYEVYLPLSRELRRRRDHWADVIEPLFPRYLFLRLGLGNDNTSPVRYTIGVHDLVRFTEDPAIVPDAVVDSLRYAADPNTGLHHPKEPLFALGDTVVIDTGPLAGLQAIFLAETSQERVTILLDLLGRENRIVVKRDILRLI
jgi:transcriptional antiterminator RfaH